MAVDFFEDQDKARRITGSLIFYFVLGLLGITAFLSLAIFLCVYLCLAFIPSLWNSWVVTNPWSFMALLAASILVFILLTSRWKMMQLRKGGGQAIAEMLGGRLLQSGTDSALERRLWHIVDEMAIASGIPVPLVYILDKEQGINAFAAGNEPHYAVLGVTRGSLQNLTRDELQGIVGHEFSHILNGDMRLNLRLIGWIYGITLIGDSGRWLLYTSVGAKKNGGSFDDEERAFVPGIFFGAILLAIGSLGTFFGNIIKASVCRQREYLADASSVEFTRNPVGLAGALKKIGGFVSGSVLQTPKATIASHMFFGQGVSPLFQRLLATHPPLVERIKRIDPAWSGAYEKINWDLREQVQRRAVLEQTGAAFLTDPEIVGDALPSGAGNRLSRTLEQSYAAYKHRLLSGLPDALFHAARVGASAPAVVYALLLNEQGAGHQACADVLVRHCDVRTVDLVQQLVPLVENAGAYVRLPLLDMAVPHLRALENEQYESVKETVRSLIRADAKMSLFEWLLWTILQYKAAPDADVEQGAEETQSLRATVEHCTALIAALATCGERDAAMSRRMAARAAEVLRMEFPDFGRQRVSLKQVDKALQRLVTLQDKSKQRLMAACVVCVCENNEVSVAEGELLRATAVRLGRPAPPVLPGQPLP